MTTSLTELTARFHAPVTMTASEVPARSDVLIVLDDDPTGTQSVSDLPVLTRWTAKDLGWAFAQNAPAIYVMTNSRSLDPADAKQINIEVAEAALAAAGDRKLTSCPALIRRCAGTSRSSPIPWLM